MNLPVKQTQIAHLTGLNQRKMKQLVYTFLMIALIGCKDRIHKEPAFTAAVIGQVIEQMTAVMIHDITNPPLAARFFSYACLAGYEVVTQNNAVYKSMHGVLNEYPD